MNSTMSLPCAKYFPRVNCLHHCTENKLRSNRNLIALLFHQYFLLHYGFVILNSIRWIMRRYIYTSPAHLGALSPFLYIFYNFSLFSMHDITNWSAFVLGLIGVSFVALGRETTADRRLLPLASNHSTLFSGKLIAVARYSWT